MLLYIQKRKILTLITIQHILVLCSCHMLGTVWLISQEAAHEQVVNEVKGSPVKIWV